MPIYEYRCHSCEQRVSLLFQSISKAEQEDAICPECGSANLERLISNIAPVKNGEELQPPSQDQEEDHPKALARTMRKADRNLSQDLGDDFKEVAYRLEEGENPNSIEKSMRKRSGEGMSTHCCPTDMSHLGE